MTHFVADPPPVDEVVTESRRCACCGAPMPEDVGVWIVAPAVAGDRTVGVLVLCSRACEAQLLEDSPVSDITERVGGDTIDRPRDEPLTIDRIGADLGAVHHSLGEVIDRVRWCVENAKPGPSEDFANALLCLTHARQVLADAGTHLHMAVTR